MGSFCSWGPINEHIIADSCGCHKLNGGDLQMIVKGSEFIREKRPQIFYLHLDALDVTGHNYGYHSQEYLTSITVQDLLLGKALKAIAEIDSDGKSLIIILSDHGGFTFTSPEVTWHGHGRDNDDCMPIFWSCRAPGVPAGKELTSPINIMDTAAVVAHFLGLQSPTAWESKLPDELLNGRYQA